MFVITLRLSINKELKTKHKNAYMFTVHISILPLTNLFYYSTKFYNIGV